MKNGLKTPSILLRATMASLSVLVLSLSLAIAQEPPGPPRDLDEQLRDIRGPVTYHGPLPLTRIVASLSALAALAGVVAYAAIRLARRQPEQQAPVEPTTILSPVEIAVKQLKTLEEAWLSAHGNCPTFADDLSAILKTFAGATVCAGAERLTTKELIVQLQRNGYAEEAGALRDLLDRCDLAKFAKHDGFAASPIPLAIRWVRAVDARQGAEAG